MTTALPARRVARRPLWWGDAAGAAAVLSVVVVVALWMRNGGVRALGQMGPALTSLGRLTGLVSADLLLLQVLLMARIPWVERAFGQDRLAHWHRWVGFSSFDLMLAHVVLITLGYAAEANSGVWAQTWDLLAHYPGMVLATASTVCLILVALTSIRAARRRLRYESWHLLHLYAYLGVALALPHELWTGNDFIGSAAARAYWWTLYVLAAGSIVAFRFGLPIYRSLRHRLRVAAVVPEGRGVFSLHFRGRQLDRMPVKAGQFFLWRFLDGAGWTRAHPYSLSAAPTAESMRITVKDLGDGSRHLSRLRPGTRVLVEGPYGRLTADRHQAHGVTLIASGIGVTPIRALLEELDFRPGAAVVIYRASNPNEFVFRDELDALAARRGARVIYLPGRRARSRTSWLPDGSARLPDDVALLRFDPTIAGNDVYVCGPKPWMESVARAARKAGVPRSQIHLERFDW